jgi:hypothetical protein
LTVGQGIRVRLLRSRFQSKDAFIQSVGVFEGLAPNADGSGSGSGSDSVGEGDLQPDVPPTEPEGPKLTIRTSKRLPALEEETASP